MSYGMLIDLEKCVGCHACAVSCKASNGTPPAVLRCKVVRSSSGSYPAVEKAIMPILCNQCENAPCVEICPSGASAKSEDGIVTIDKEVCIGCKSCMEACPYGSRHFCDLSVGYFEEGLNPYEEVAYEKMVDKTVDKCDFCLSRAEDGNAPEPACVAACITNARVFGELDSIISDAGARDGYQLNAELGTNPSVWYLPQV